MHRGDGFAQRADGRRSADGRILLRTLRQIRSRSVPGLQIPVGRLTAPAGKCEGGSRESHQALAKELESAIVESS
jgi:hypothetical protein